MAVTHCSFHQGKSFLHPQPPEVLVEESGMAAQKIRTEVCLYRVYLTQKDNHLPLHWHLKNKRFKSCQQPVLCEFILN